MTMESDSFIEITRKASEVVDELSPKTNGKPAEMPSETEERTPEQTVEELVELARKMLGSGTSSSGKAGYTDGATLVQGAGRVTSLGEGKSRAA